MNKFVVLSGGKRPFLLRLASAALLAGAVYLLVKFFINVPITNTEAYRISFLKLIEVEVYIISFAIFFSVVKNHHFNISENKYRIYYSVGVFGYGKWENIDKLSYVSVNLNSKDVYEVLIWDESNTRFKISFFETSEEANKTAKYFSEKFKIDFYSKH